MKPTRALCLCLLLSACATDRASFRPTDNVQAVGQGGQPAAAYEVRVATGTLARVKVWSDGAYLDRDQRTILHQVVELQNIGQVPVRLLRDQLRLEVFGRSGDPIPPPQLTSLTTSRPSAELAVPPGEVATVHLYFAMQSRVDPDDIGGLRLRWSLGYDDGRRYVQFTEFRQVPETRYAAGVVLYDPVFGFYDPFLYGPPYRYYLHRRVPVGRVIVVRPEPHRRDHRGEPPRRSSR